MKVRVIEEKIFTVPDILLEDFKASLESGDSVALDELICDIEYRDGYDDLKTISIEEVKE